MTDAWGITDGYHDTEGRWHETGDDARSAFLAAMHSEGRDSPPAPPPMWFMRIGTRHDLDRPCDLLLEDGTLIEALTVLPPDLPLGYHSLRPGDGGEDTTLVVTPGRCSTPARSWGFATQIYSLRSAGSWGVGDFADLRTVAEWSSSLGARVLLVNPIHAVPLTLPIEPSPYFASSRLFRNPLYLRVEEIPGADLHGERISALATQGRVLSKLPLLDRTAMARLKIEAFGMLFTHFEEHAGDAERTSFLAHLRKEGESLLRFATYCALAEVHGADYWRWPDELRHPSAPAVARFRESATRRIRFYQWLQWETARQLDDASSSITLITDLAVGFDASGADAWMFQDLLAIGCRVGAPPDTFNQLGQDWGLPPFVPWLLRKARYEPYIATLRACLANGGVRIDHVMGLFRLWWVPPDAGPAAGGYVRYPSSDLLDLLALEAHRAGAFVVGEDLGTVEPEVRDELLSRGVLSYRVLWFEDDPIKAFPRQAIAAAGTHDLSTVAGTWSGSDAAMKEELGLPGAAEEGQFLRHRLNEVTGLPPGTAPERVVQAVHEALARVPALLTTVTLEDAAVMEARVNLPGTIDEYPNWRVPLSISLDDLMTSPTALALAAIMQAACEPRPAAR